MIDCLVDTYVHVIAFASECVEGWGRRVGGHMASWKGNDGESEVDFGLNLEAIAGWVGVKTSGRSLISTRWDFIRTRHKMGYRT